MTWTWRPQGGLAPLPRRLHRLRAAWSKEPGETLADCVHAVSRAAHETVISADDVQRELERQAARLVYVGVR